MDGLRLEDMDRVAEGLFSATGPLLDKVASKGTILRAYVAIASVGEQSSLMIYLECVESQADVLQSQTEPTKCCAQ